MLDLVVEPVKYESLDACRTEDKIMRGRRRGRNRPSSQDPLDQGSDTGSTSVGTGSVTLIHTPPPPPASESDDDAPSGAASSPSSSPTTPVAPSPQRNIEETISDVVTAQAELDNLLTPSTTAVKSVVIEEETIVEPERFSDTPVAPDAPPVRTPPPAIEVNRPSEDHEHQPEVVVEAPIAPEKAVTEVVPSPPEPLVDDLVVAPVVAEPAVVHQEEPAPEVEARLTVEAQAASGNPLPRVLAVANQKGGVGKTTTSVNLGAALAELGFRVLVIDLDPQGNATTGLGIDARNFELSMYDVLMRDSSLEDCVEPTSMKNLFVAPATIALAGAEIELVPAFSRELKLKKSIESIIDDFDYVLIDCPPSLGLITVNALAAADEVLVPIQCEYYALEGLSQLMRNVHLVASNLNPKLDISTIVLTMYDARTKLSDQVANEVRLHFGTKVCRSVIPRTVRLSEAPSFGQPITAFDPASRGAIAYRELAKEVSGGTT
jgi:chromosome partitioning protein